MDYLDKTNQKKSLEVLFRKAFSYVLDSLNKKGDYLISLTLVSKEEQKKLNSSFRNINKSTDVLTFPYGDMSKENTGEFVDLGSIIICPEIAEKQAVEYAHPFEREMIFLFIHGLLHIFGYDHIKPEEAEIMFALQNKLLNRFPYDFYTDLRVLKKELVKAREMAVATYSHFRVGAVVVTKDLKYHLGFNIENAAYSACVCAERVALFSTYAKGYTKDDIVALGCLTDSKNVGTCCGVCRQVMSELMHPYAPVYIFSGDLKEHLFTTVEELLPASFSKGDLQA